MSDSRSVSALRQRARSISVNFMATQFSLERPADVREIIALGAAER